MRNYAIVTGGASGIGRATVSRLLSGGWRVAALDQSADGLAALAGEHHGHGDMLRTQVCDVASEPDVERAFAAVGEDTLNGLVLSAGLLRVGRLDTMSADDFDALFSVNVRGLWLCARAGLPMLERAAARGDTARIVNLASIAGIRHKINSGAYAATKAAVIALTKVLAVEVAAAGVLVNAVAPATVDTPMIAPHVGGGDNSGYKTSGTSPLGRIAGPEDIAAVIDVLLGKDTGYVTGTVVPVDGGTTAAFVPN